MFRDSANEFTDLGSDLRALIPVLQETFRSIGALAEMLERDPSALVFGRNATSRTGGKR